MYVVRIVSIKKILWKYNSLQNLRYAAQSYEVNILSRGKRDYRRGLDC
jgi:hypothetical protein